MMHFIPPSTLLASAQSMNGLPIQSHHPNADANLGCLESLFFSHTTKIVVSLYAALRQDEYKDSAVHLPCTPSGTNRGPSTHYPSSHSSPVFLALQERVDCLTLGGPSVVNRSLLLVAKDSSCSVVDILVVEDSRRVLTSGAPNQRRRSFPDRGSTAEVRCRVGYPRSRNLDHDFAGYAFAAARIAEVRAGVRMRSGSDERSNLLASLVSSHEAAY